MESFSQGSLRGSVPPLLGDHNDRGLLCAEVNPNGPGLQAYWNGEDAMLIGGEEVGEW